MNFFSKERPNSIVPWKRPLPSIEVIEEMEAKLDQALLEGAESIVDIRFSGKERYSFWTISDWKWRRRLVEAKGDWQAAEMWLTDVKAGRNILDRDLVEDVDEARELLSVLAWNEDISIRGAAAKTRELSQFLSDRWLNDIAMELMISHLDSRLRARGVSEKGVILKLLAFDATLLSAKDNDYSHVVLAGVVTMVKDFGKTDLYFIHNLNGNHWIAVHVDFTKKLIEIGKLYYCSRK